LRPSSLQPSNLLPLLWLRRRGEQGWHFDPLSALIGAISALLLLALLYRYRAVLKARLRALREWVTSLVEHIGASFEERYREHLTARSEAQHVLAGQVPLAAVYIPPHLRAPPLSPGEDDESGLPEEAARERYQRLSGYRPQRTFPLSQALQQCPRLAVAGPPGAGRTALLAYLAQTYAAGEAGAHLTLDEDRLPILASLESLSLPPDDDDLLAPLHDYLTAQHGRFTGRTAARRMREYMPQGRCLLLLDGLDELDGDHRLTALNWLASLVNTYPDNRYILAAPPAGYASLEDMGFTVLPLAEVTPEQAMDYARRWRTAQGEPAEPVGEEWQERLEVWWADYQGPARWLDLALLARIHDPDEKRPRQRAELFAAAVTAMLEEMPEEMPLTVTQLREALSRLALQMMQRGEHTAAREAVEALCEIYLPEEDKSDSSEGEISSSTGQSPVLQTLRKMPFPEVSSTSRALQTIRKALIEDVALLVEVGSEHYAFRHPSLRAFLAAEALSHLDDPRWVLEHLDDPCWEEVLRFYAALGGASLLVPALLSGEDDLFHTRLFRAADYLAQAPQVDEGLRGQVLRKLAAVFLKPQQILTLRHRAAEALVRIPDKGVPYLFAQALRANEPDLRAEAVWGLAALGDRRVVPVLIELLEKEEEWPVRVAIARALGQLGGDKAIDGLVLALQDEDDSVRRAAAEALATLGEEGRAILEEALDMDDIFLRRAAVYGLGTLGGEEIRARLDHVQRYDREWYVKSAAREMLDRLEAEQAPVELRPRRVEDEPWLLTWAAKRGMGVPAGEKALDTLEQALREGPWPVRMAALETMGTLGRERFIPLLQETLRDPDPLIREAAFIALEAIARRTGFPINLPESSSGTR